MKILVLADIEASGEWIATQSVLSEMKKTTPSIRLYLVAYGKNTLFLNKALFHDIKSITKPTIDPPFKYYRQLILEIINGIKAIFSMTKKWKKFDLIITTNYSLFLPAKLALPFCHSIFFFHGVRHDYDINFRSFNFYMFLRKSLETFGWLIADVITIPSKPAGLLLKKRLGPLSDHKQIVKLPNPVATPFQKKYSQKQLKDFRERYSIPKNKKIIVYAGRIAEKKGLENLIRSFVLLNKTNPETLLVFAHPSFDISTQVIKTIKHIIKKNKLGSSVFFIKDLTNDEITKLYQISRCAILPSEIEMSSLFLLESIFSGLPIFSTTAGNAENLLKSIDRSFILKNNCPKNICDRLRIYFSKTPRWQKSIRNKLLELSRSYQSAYDKAINDFFISYLSK